VLLVGLLLNATLGWSWADPIAALVIAGVAVKEGLEAWRGDSCCAPNLHAAEDACGSHQPEGAAVTLSPEASNQLPVAPAAITETSAGACSCCKHD